MINQNSTIVEIVGEFSNNQYWQECKEEFVLSKVDLNIKFFDIGQENLDLTNNKILEEVDRAISTEKLAICSPNTSIELEGVEVIKCAEDTPEAIKGAWLQLLDRIL